MGAPDPHFCPGCGTRFSEPGIVTIVITTDEGIEMGGTLAWKCLLCGHEWIEVE
jgi:hypothetical protein